MCRKRAEMKTLIVGVGGMTNGGKTTLSESLKQQIPHSCIIAQDTYFKDDSVVPVDNNGFKQYDMLSALHMDQMMTDVNLWRKDPEAFLKARSPTHTVGNGVYLLIVEGFLIFNYRPLNELFERRYFIEISYDVCKTRRRSCFHSTYDFRGCTPLPILRATSKDTCGQCT